MLTLAAINKKSSCPISAGAERQHANAVFEKQFQETRPTPTASLVVMHLV